ncbi:MAG: 5'/3'-nucleotidase SurE [Caldithrix sp.]|nr:5'/3'-nucleotidase SurE [Caldithrix sp.]
MSKKQTSILITNDDGIYAEGIYHLKKALQGLGKITVVAPLVEKSAVGHAITLSDPLRVMEIDRYGEFFGYAVNGTPADCVKIGGRCILEDKPDIVVSGINQGSNTGMNIIYSGTVSAAAEGIIMNIPSVAISLTSYTKKEFAYSRKIARRVTSEVLNHGLPDGTLINVNVPAVKEKEIEGVVVTRQGKGRFEEAFDRREDPNKRTYYWLTGKRMLLDNDEDVDDVVIHKNMVSITPIHYDLTNYRFLEELKTGKLGP